MATDVIKSIGTTGKDYSTLQAFFDAVPADLVAADQRWIGEVYLGEIVVTAEQLLSARTVDATRNVIVRAAAGNGIKDHADKLTNALAYDASKGAAIKSNVQFAPAIHMVPAFSQVIGLQVKTAYVEALAVIKMPAADYRVEGCIIDSAAGECISSDDFRPNIINNVLISQQINKLCLSLNFGSGGQVTGNTLYSASGSTGTAITCESATGNTLTGNALFGWATSFQNPGATSDYNASSSTISVGTHNLTGLTFADHFVSASDLKLKVGSALISAGVAVSGRTTDILGRALGSPPSIGAYEYLASVPGATINLVGTNSTQDATSGTGAVTVTPPVAGTVNLVGTNSTQSATSGTGVVTVTAAAGTLTLPPMKNNTGTLLASLTGITLHVYNASTGALVVTKTGQTTNASGVLTANDSLIVAGTQYRVVIILGTGAEGMDKATAA